MATNYLHYGFVSLDDDFDEGIKKILKDKGFEYKPWGPQWYAKADNVYLKDFDEWAIKLMCDKIEIQKLSEKIVDDCKYLSIPPC